MYYDSTGDGVNDSSQQTDGDTILSGDQPTIIAITASANISNSSKSVSLHIDQDNDGFISPGDTLRYTVVITNSGNQNSTTLTFVDPLPTETTYAGNLDSSNGSASYNTGSKQIEWTGDVNAGDSTTISFDVIVNSGIIVGTVISNQGIITYDGNTIYTDGNPTQPGKQTTDVTVGGSPQGLAIKSVTDENGGNLVPGDILLYTIVMHNQSGYTVNGIEFVDSIPSNTSYVTASVSAPPGSTVVSETPTLDITGINVPAHGQVSLSFRVKVNDTLPAGVTQISNQGIVYYDSTGDGVNDSSQQTDGDTNISGNQPTIMLVTAGANFSNSSKSVSLYIDQDDDGFISPGDTLRYTVVITNSGDQNSTTLTFVDPLPTETTYAGNLDSSNGSASYNAGSRQIEWTGDVNAGDSTTISFDVIINSEIIVGTVISNQGIITYDGNTIYTDGNSTQPGKQTTDVTVGGSPQGLAIKSVTDENGGNLVPGDILLYTIVMHNQSGYTVNGIEFVDSIPSNTSYVTASVSAPPGSTVVSETPTLDITGINVPAHGQVSLSFRVKVNDPLPVGVTQISNQGIVNYDSTGDGVNDSSQQTDGDISLSGYQPTIIEIVIMHTSIIEHPLKLTNSPRATFSFTGSAGSHSYTFECKLDKGEWEECTSPQIYNNLSVGNHTFQVRTVDENGARDPLPANFSWIIEANEAEVNPINTGFAPNLLTILPFQTTSYSKYEDLWLEIPSLNVQMQIVGVPQSVDGTWDVTWLGNDAGWLNGSAFPSYLGNSVITGHLYNSNGQPGPFIHLSKMQYDDKIIVHVWGTQYTYQVREVFQVNPMDTAEMLKHEELSWLTLITCGGYDEKTNSYKYRVLVHSGAHRS